MRAHEAASWFHLLQHHHHHAFRNAPSHLHQEGSFQRPILVFGRPTFARPRALLIAFVACLLIPAFPTPHRAFEIRLQKSESIATEQLKASQTRIHQLEITTLRAVTTANERIQAAERRMSQALDVARLADEDRMKVVKDRNEIEERLKKMKEICETVKGERERERERSEGAIRELEGRDNVIMELERTVSQMEKGVQMRQEEARLRRAESLEWWIGLGTGCLMTIGGVGCVFSFGLSAATASVTAAGLTGGMTIGGVICVMDKVLSPGTKEFLRRFLMGLIDEFALAWFVRYWSLSHAIEPPPPYLMEDY